MTGDKLTLVDGIELGRRIWNLDNAIWTLQGRHRDIVQFAPYIYDTKYEKNELFPFYMWPCRDEKGDWAYTDLMGRSIDRKGFEEWKTIFYRLEGWDTKTGWPTARTLAELDLGFVADALKRPTASVRRKRYEPPPCRCRPRSSPDGSSRKCGYADRLPAGRFTARLGIMRGTVRGLPELHLYLAPDERSLPAVNLDRLADWIEAVVADAELARATRAAARGAAATSMRASRPTPGGAAARPGAGGRSAPEAPRPAAARTERHVKQASLALAPSCALPVARPGDGRQGRRRLHRGAALRLHGDGKREPRPVLAGVRRPLGRRHAWDVRLQARGGQRPLHPEGRRRRQEGRQVAGRARHGRRAQGHAVPDDRHRVRRQDRAIRCVRDALDRRRRGRWLPARQDHRQRRVPDVGGEEALRRKPVDRPGEIRQSRRRARRCAPGLPATVRPRKLSAAERGTAPDRVALTGTQVPVDLAEGVRVAAVSVRLEGSTGDTGKDAELRRQVEAQGDTMRDVPLQRFVAEGLLQRIRGIPGVAHAELAAFQAVPSGRVVLVITATAAPVAGKLPERGARALRHRRARFAADPLPGRSLVVEGDPQRRRGRLRDVESASSASPISSPWGTRRRVIRRDPDRPHGRKPTSSRGSAGSSGWGTRPLYPYGSVTYLDVGVVGPGHLRLRIPPPRRVRAGVRRRRRQPPWQGQRVQRLGRPADLPAAAGIPRSPRSPARPTSARLPRCGSVRGSPTTGPWSPRSSTARSRPRAFCSSRPSSREWRQTPA